MQLRPRNRSYKYPMLLALLGLALSTPCRAGSMAGSEGVAAKINTMARRQTTTPVVPVKPRILELKPLPAQRLARLSKEARAKYDQAMKALDKINYDKTADYLQQAVQIQPDNVYLRLMLIQLVQYLGDTRTGPESIKHYDTAIDNLQAMINSPLMNVREKQRAQGAMETLVALRQSISEREEKRHQAGFDIAKQYSQEIFQETDKRERERQDRMGQVEAYVKSVNTPAMGRERPAGNFRLQPGNYSLQGSQLPPR